MTARKLLYLFLLIWSAWKLNFKCREKMDIESRQFKPYKWKTPTADREARWWRHNIDRLHSVQWSQQSHGNWMCWFVDRTLIGWLASFSLQIWLQEWNGQQRAETAVIAPTSTRRGDGYSAIQAVRLIHQISGLFVCVIQLDSDHSLLFIWERDAVSQSVNHTNPRVDTRQQKKKEDEVMVIAQSNTILHLRHSTCLLCCFVDRTFFEWLWLLRRKEKQKRRKSHQRTKAGRTNGWSKYRRVPQ